MSLQEIAPIIAAAVRPERFFVGSAGSMSLVHRPEETVRWELFRGHLLDAGQTRETRCFAVWKLLFRWPDDDQQQPLLAIYYDQAEEVIHVTRGILVYGWEAFESAPQVIESREVQVWRRELVGTLHLRNATAERMERELTLAVQQAIFGTSRLPITSLESPLPAFSLGRLAYFPFLDKRDWERVPQAETPVSTIVDLLARGVSAAESTNDQARLFEVLLRAADAAEIPHLAIEFYQRWIAAGRTTEQLPAVVRTLFGQVALSPYTDFGARLIAVLECWANNGVLGPAPVIDLLSYMLRHLVRHLTAFDLVTFHNRGANYPDAILLDDLLKACLRMIRSHMGLFRDSPHDSTQFQRAARLRRRALRQGWLARKTYEGLPVPSTPTSPGENLRVLPRRFPRVSEEELLHAGQRTAKLFDGDPLDAWCCHKVRPVLLQACADVSLDEELRELGLATYLDRPLGLAKEPGEVDRTPLLSYEAFSPSIAVERMQQLSRWGLLAAGTAKEQWTIRANQLAATGWPVARLKGPERPGVAALEDARKAADDFVFLRTTTRSCREFYSGFDWTPLAAYDPDTVRWLHEANDVLLIRVESASSEGIQQGRLTAFDQNMQPRLDFFWPIGAGEINAWALRNGLEYPRQGWEAQLPGQPPVRLPIPLCSAE